MNIGSISGRNVFYPAFNRVKTVQPSTIMEEDTGGPLTANYFGEKEGEHAIASIGFPGGKNYSIWDDPDSDDPQQVIVKRYYEKTELQSYKVNVAEVRTDNASWIEMLAYAACSNVDYEFDYLTSAPYAIVGEDFYDKVDECEKMNYREMVREMMQMQYDNGYLPSYLRYKKLYDCMKKVYHTNK